MTGRFEVEAEVTGKVWKIEASLGDAMEADDTIMIVESMKMEIPVSCPQAGTLVEIRVREGDPVQEGQVVAILER
jgi:acetyl-CoA carboxylase biotin carboxyl carrier protein